MKPQDLLAVNRPPRICLVGTAGTGKTALAAQANKAYCFDFDDGMRTCLNLQDKFRDNRMSVEFDTYENTGNMTNAFLKAKKQMMKLQDKAADGKLEYDSIIIDSWTGCCDKIRQHIMGMSGNPFANPQIQHWGMMVTEAESFLHMARTLKRLLIVTAHENLIETDGETSLRIASMTRAHGLNKMAYLFDEVLRTKTRKTGRDEFKYYVTGKGDSTLPTRTRSGLTGDFRHDEVGLAGLLEHIGYKTGEQS